MKGINKIKLPLIGVLLPFVLTSCDPNVEYQQVVQNSSEHGIWLIMHDSYPHDEVYVDNYTQDSFYVAPNSETVLYAITRIGKPGEYSNCDLYADSITTRVEGYDTLRVTSNLNDTYSWVFREFDRDKSGRCECRFIILDTDIETVNVAQP